MVSIKDYAHQKGVSYEAVRKQVKRYEKELEGHIHKQGRTQFLDDEAVAILDERRAQNPIVIYEQGKDDELERLREENQLLHNKVEYLQDRLLQSNDKIQLLQEEKIALLEAAKEQPEPHKWRWPWQKG